MNKEAWKTLAFVLVGLVAAVLSTGIDRSLRSQTSPDALIALILFSVAVVGYAGTYVAELVGTNIEEEGGRIKVYVKSLYIYVITWFVIYVLLYNEFVFTG